MSDAPLATPMERRKRIQVIEERAGRPGRGHAVLFRGRYEEFPVSSVPHDALVYRFDNGRLAAALDEQADKAGTTLDAMRRKAEGAEIQGLLHGLLLAKANSPDGPIFAELERLGQQTEPLLVLFDGTVVNGNRRLAAMRALLARDERRYESFRQPAVAVLPKSTEPAEIEYVEAALQMAPETKLSYGWLERRLKLRRQQNKLRLPLDEILAAYRIADASEIARELRELALAESYLADYRGEPHAYSLIADGEELFVGLEEQLSRLPLGLGSLWRLAGFVMVDGRPPSAAQKSAQSGAQKRGAKAANPLVRLFPFAPPLPAELPLSAQQRLAEEFGIATEGASGSNGLGGNALEELLAIFRDRSRSTATAQAIADTLDEIRLEHDERSAPERILIKVREAGRMIARLEPQRLSPEQRRHLSAELAALTAHASYLLGEMEERPVVPKSWNYSKAIVRPPYWKIPWRLMRKMGWVKPTSH